MKKLSTALLGAIFLAGASGAASAADAYQRGGLKDAPEAYYPPITWAGFYAGVHAGGAFGGEATPDDDFFATEDLDNAFTGGAHLGYNWQASSNWVVGIEGSISSLGLELSDVEGGFEWSDYVASIRGRAGVAFESNLVYGTAGIAFLGYADDAADILEEDTGVGFVIGAGWERKISDSVSFGVEGLYYNFNDDHSEFPIEVETDFFTVTARLNYHFNAGGYDLLK